MIERPPTPWKRYGGYFGAVVLGVAAWQVLSPKKEDQPAERPRTEMSSQLAATGTVPASPRAKPELQIARSATHAPRAPGMLDEEIRMVVENFRKTAGGTVLKGSEGWVAYANPANDAHGKAQMSHFVEFAELRRKRDAMYLAALTDILTLSDEQQTQVRERLQNLAEKQVQSYQQGTASFDEVPYRDDSYAPWKLCDLTPAQEKLTHKNEIFSVAPLLPWLNTRAQPLPTSDSLLAFTRLLSPGQLMLGLLSQPQWDDVLIQELDGKAPPEPEPLPTAPAAVAPVSTRETPAPVQPAPPEVPPETAEPAQGDEPTEPEE